ncbi:YihY/virulence factor BrkB family protein [Pollutibacter soli]|uniref:YihY/virulence factor BrkB family protein n=1 Tax=Pollutibacter soli TaxID=3034157 RepID=UPI003013668D
MIKLQRIILNSLPVRFVIRKSKKMILPGFEGIPLYDVGKFFFQQTQQIGLNDRAASISFNFLLAVPPLCIFIFTMLANLPWSQKLYIEANDLIRQISPDESTYTILKSIMDDFFKPGSGFISIGLILAIYFSSNAMINIMYTFNKSMLHIETESRNFLEKRWEAIKLTVILVFLIIGTLLVMLTQGALLDVIRKWLGLRDESITWLVQLIRFSITFLLVFFAVALIYRFAPAVQKKWKLKSPGAILATSVILIFTYLFSYWVNNFASYNKVYGSIGSILILMLLVFVNSMVLLIGFELNVSINSLKSLAQKRQKEENRKVTN